MGSISKEMIMIAATLVIGLILFLIFTNIYSTALYSKCWKDSIKEVKSVVYGSISGFGKKDKVALTLRPCIDKIIFGSYDDCNEFCDSLKDEKDKCKDRCDNCENSEGCVVVVPKVPSKWGYVKFWEWGKKSPWEIFRERSGKIEVYKTDGFQNPLVLEGSDKGEMVCLTLRKIETLYSVEVKPIKEKDEC